MSCVVNLFNDVLVGATAGGTFVFDFYSTTQDGTADSGGSIIDIDVNSNVDFNNAVVGFYYFTYTVGEGDCEVSLQFWVQVVEQPNAGIGQTLNLCLDEGAVNLFSLLTGSPQLTGTWSGSGTESAGYIPNLSNDPTDDEFDPSLSGTGLFTFVYTVAVQVPGGYVIANCPDCQNATATVIINVISCSPPPPCDAGESNQLNVCRTAACTFNLFDFLLGTPQQNGEWIQLAGSPQVIVITGGYLGTVNFINAQVGTYNFEYSLDNVDPACGDTAIITVNVVNEPNAGNNLNINLCETMGNTNLFSLLSGNPTPGGIWEISPVLPVGTFTANGFINPAIGDAGTYTVTYTVTTATPNNPCNTVCQDVSTHIINIHTNCNAGINSSGQVCQDDSFTLDAATLLNGDSGGEWFVFGQSVTCNNVFTQAIFSVNGGAQQNYQGQYLNDGDVLSNFANLGCIALTYRCEGSHPLCNDSASFMLTVVNCPPACNASVTISAVNCNLSSVISGTCPNPIYQWQQLISGQFVDISGANNSTYTGVNGATYRLKVTNCTNCGTLLSNQITVSCPPPPGTIISCTLTYNTTFQRLEAILSNTSGAGVNVNYQFNRYQNNTPSCTNCSGVLGASCSGTVFVGAGQSVTVLCNVSQISVEQCFRFVAFCNTCNSTLCCTKIPATAPLMNYVINTLPAFTEISGVTVTIAGSNVIWNKANFPAQFNCADYESTKPNGIINGNNNCSLAALVHDMNQRLVAGIHAGRVRLIQSAKSSSIRVDNTDIIFVNILLLGGGNIPFATTTVTGCDPVGSWHFQETESKSNFTVELDASNGGSYNIFTQMLQKYFPEIPNTGTFTQATGTAELAGCIEINTNCLNPVGATITITNGGANHGLLQWSSFVPLNLDEFNNCYFEIRYLFQMTSTPDNCLECMLITIKFKP